MAYSGRYVPRNMHKYRGDHTKIQYRSSWEKWFMEYLDSNDKVVQWNSEQVVIPYFSNADGKKRRYYMDFWAKFKVDDQYKEFIFEIKPDKETKEPKKPSRLTTQAKQRFINELYTWRVNKDKWLAATKYAEKNKMSFKILTEHSLRSMGFTGGVK